MLKVKLYLREYFLCIALAKCLGEPFRRVSIMFSIVAAILTMTQRNDILGNRAGTLWVRERYPMIGGRAVKHPVQLATTNSAAVVEVSKCILPLLMGERIRQRQFPCLSSIIRSTRSFKIMPTPIPPFLVTRLAIFFSPLFMLFSVVFPVFYVPIAALLIALLPVLFAVILLGYITARFALAMETARLLFVPVEIVSRWRKFSATSRAAFKRYIHEVFSYSSYWLGHGQAIGHAFQSVNYSDLARIAIIPKVEGVCYAS